MKNTFLINGSVTAFPSAELHVFKLLPVKGELKQWICLSPRSPRGLVTRLRVGLCVIRVPGSTTEVRRGNSEVRRGKVGGD